MKQSLFLVLFLASTKVIFGQSYKNSIPATSNQINPNNTYVEGYIKKNGDYVPSYQRTERNATNWDNYSTQRNKNPYTQQEGTKARDYSNESLNYGQGQKIQTGERGGQYYINSNGNKTYVPKQKKW